MKRLEDLQTMTFYKERLYLPYGENKQKGTAIFSLNTSQKAIADILSNNHKMLSNNGNVYQNYYYEFRDMPNSVKSKRIRTRLTNVATAKKTRLADYAAIKTFNEDIQTRITLNPGGFNLVYDLQPVVTLYNKVDILTKLSLKEKLTTFIDTINSAYNNTKLPGYNKTVIFVNVDEYNKDKKPFSDITYIISALLHRSPKFIDSVNRPNFKVLFYTNNGYFLMDLSKELTKDNMNTFNRLLKRLKPLIPVDKDVDKGEKEDVQRVIANKAAKSMGSNLTGDDNLEDAILPDDVLSVDDDIVDSVKNEIDDIEDLDTSETVDKIDDALEKDEDLKREYLNAITTKHVGKTRSEASLKRDAMLREKQKDIKIKSKTIGELTEEKNIPVVKTHKVDIDTVLNKNMTNITFPEVDKTYIHELYDHDVANVITCLNDKSIPVTITNVKVEDTSDELTLKETYTVTLEDENRKRHTLKFSLPKFIDDEFIYVNGSKKTIQNQIFGIPIIKTGPDEVQVITNYNKVFIRRVGPKLNRNVDKFRKIMEKHPEAVSTTSGCNTDLNKEYLTFLEYDEYAKSYNEITIGKYHFVLNQIKLHELFDGKEESRGAKYLVGYYKEKGAIQPIYYDINAESIDFIEFMAKHLPPELYDEYQKNTSGKKLMYSEATIMAKHIPLVIILSYFEGLSKVITKFNTLTTGEKVYFTDKKPSNKDGITSIKFKDGYLCYSLSNTEAELLFNGFTSVNLGDFDISSMDERPTYLDIFSILFGSSLSIADALLNYYDFMIDPITLEILQLLDYPTDFISLFIFAANLLADNDYKSDIDMNQYRIRKSEVIPALLYKQISIAYARYRRTANNPNPVKISMDENAVIKELVALPTVEDYSELSPMVEMHKNGLASMKGANGMNMDRAYKLDKRAFDDSMIGVVGISTDPGPNCGKIRQLVAEPTVINARGFMDLNNRKDVDKLIDTNLSTPVELLTTMTATHDDNNRVAMASKQTGHVIPVRNNCPMLVSNGMDQAVHFRTGNGFSVVAKENGEVIELDESAEIMIVEYKSGERQAIDLSKRVVKNGGGGFYLMNQLVPKVKVGQTFKKDAILAYDPKYYKDQSKHFGNRLTMGSLMKVVVASNYATYEDSAFITKHMSESMATDISMKHDIILGANSNVDYIVNIGDNVTIGDDLIKFDTSYDDEGLNQMLAGIRDETKEEIINLGKSSLHSHYTGVVSDIYIYCTVDLDELSPSLRKIVKQYQTGVKKRKDLLDKYDPDNKGKPYRMGMMIDKSDKKTETDEYGKVQGQDVGRGVKIVFYITYHDELSDGDKLAAQTANKNTIGYQIPRGFEPYSESRPYEEISGVVAPSAVLQRGTPSVIIVGCAQKVLIELKRKMYTVLTGENFDEILKQKQPYMVHEFVQTKESISNLPGITDEQISILESVFDLYKDGSNKYRSNKMYTNQDIILALNDEVDMSYMIESFNIVIENHNAVLNDNEIVAITDIAVNESIRLKL